MSTTAEFLVRFVSFFFSSKSPIAELRKKTCSAVVTLAAISTSANCSNSATTKTVPLITAATKLITTDTACRFIPNPRCFVVTSRRVLGAHALYHLLAQRVQAIHDPVCFHIDQCVAFDFPITGLRQKVMILAQVWKFIQLYVFAAKRRRKQFERLLHVRGKRA